jgi:hypothetical protein
MRYDTSSFIVKYTYFVTLINFRRWILLFPLLVNFSSFVTTPRMVVNLWFRSTFAYTLIFRWAFFQNTMPVILVISHSPIFFISVTFLNDGIIHEIFYFEKNIYSRGKSFIYSLFLVLFFFNIFNISNTITFFWRFWTSICFRDCLYKIIIINN